MEEDKVGITPEKDSVIERGWAPLTALTTTTVLMRAFFTLVLPAAVLSGLIVRNCITVPLASLGYALLVWDAMYGTFRRVRVMYDLRKFEPDIRGKLTAVDWAKKAKALVAVDLIKSFAYFIYAFALAYAFVSYLRPDAFNVRLSVGTALYFSLTTIATVGYGDICPASPAARALAATEILVGLLFVVLVFSTLATHLQRKIE